MVDIHGMSAPKIDLVDLAARFAGQWVALDPETGAVVAAGSTAVDVCAAAESDGLDAPMVLHILPDYGVLALGVELIDTRYSWKPEIAFVPKLPIPLLGHHGFFEHFEVRFKTSIRWFRIHLK